MKRSASMTVDKYTNDIIFEHYFLYSWRQGIVGPENVAIGKHVDYFDRQLPLIANRDEAGRHCTKQLQERYLKYIFRIKSNESLKRE